MKDVKSLEVLFARFGSQVKMLFPLSEKRFLIHVKVSWTAYTTIA